MPGRGRYWKVGGLNDEHIKEEDLSQALQTKVNSGGGGVVEKLAETTLSSAVTNTQLSFTAVNRDDYAEFWLVIKGSISADGDVYANINGVTGTGYSCFGTFIEATAITNYNLGGTLGLYFNAESIPGSGIHADRDFVGKHTIIGGDTVELDKIKGWTDSSYDRETSAVPVGIRGIITMSGLASSTISSFEIFVQGGGKLKIGTKITVFGVKTA